MPVINRITELFAKLKDAAGNGITSTDIGGGKRALDVNTNVSVSLDKARIRDATDENKLLVVDGNGRIGVIISVDGSPIDPRNIRALTTADVISAVQSGTWNINNITGTISLPTGAATSVNQESTNSKLDTISEDLLTHLIRRIYDKDDNGLTSSDIGSSKRALDVLTVLRDGTNPLNKVKIDSSGNLYTVTPQPETPAGKTSINNTQQSDVSGTIDSYTIIPSGQIITIQRMKAGAEMDTVAGSKVELYYAPNGNTTGIMLIEAEYVNGSSVFVDLNYVSPAGDGTKAILLRRQRLGGGAVEIFGKWEGYY